MNRNSRERYNLGTCRNLCEDPFLLFIFLDDDESSWGQTEIIKYWYNHVVEGIQYIESNAKNYQVNLKISKGYYATNEKFNMKYNGIITKNLMEKTVEKDILDQVASCLRFKSKKEMHEYLKKYSGKDQVGYILLLNKRGRSYARNANKKSLKNYMEYCVVFNGYINSSYPPCTASLVHEILHLFGGEDYYDPYNRYPKRKIMTEKLYPNDIMMCIKRNVTENQIGPYTAFTIGWIDDLPMECGTNEWWE